MSSPESRVAKRACYGIGTRSSLLALNTTFVILSGRAADAKKRVVAPDRVRQVLLAALATRRPKPIQMPTRLNSRRCGHSARGDPARLFGYEDDIRGQTTYHYPGLRSDDDSALLGVIVLSRLRCGVTLP